MTPKPAILFYITGSPQHRLIFAKKSALTHSPPWQRLPELLALQSQISEVDGFSAFPVLRNPDAQGHIIPQYGSINLLHTQQMKRAIIMYGLHSPFTKELLNAVASSIGNFTPYDWRTLIKAPLKPGEYLQWTMWLQGMAQDRANSNARAGTAQKQITFEILTHTGQCDAIEAQIQSPPWWKTNCNNCSHLVLAVCFSICNYIMNFVSKWLRHLSYK